MNWEPILVCAVSAVIIGAWGYIAYKVFEHDAKVAREKRSHNLAALRQSGQDKTRTMDIHR